MKILFNFLTAVFGIVVLVGCGGGGGSSDTDVQLPYIEDSKFFTSFKLSDNDIALVEKSLSYYPVSDSVYSDFEKVIIDQGFIYKIDECDEDCYTANNETVRTYLGIDNTTNKRYITISFDNTTIDTTDEEIIEFFPKIDASLAIRFLSIDFNDNKSATFAEHENYLRDELKFEDYDDSYSDDGHSNKCLKNDKKDGIVYLICYDDDGYHVSWGVVRKTVFDAVFQYPAWSANKTITAQYQGEDGLTHSFYVTTSGNSISTLGYMGYHGNGGSQSVRLTYTNKGFKGNLNARWYDVQNSIFAENQFYLAPLSNNNYTLDLLVKYWTDNQAGMGGIISNDLRYDPNTNKFYGKVEADYPSSYTYISGDRLGILSTNDGGIKLAIGRSSDKKIVEYYYSETIYLR
ncbi:MAG: hypothetical protein LBG21_00400 [Campylobacteraceae bacterium]|jgi:hypothetical protein|nr:hypothetical protein [Campylobacteraceae bacterium]